MKRKKTKDPKGSVPGASLGFSSRAIHEGQDYRGESGAVIPPLYLTSTFATGNPAGFDYTRSGNPNFVNLEQTLASLEQAQYATVFGSGVGAMTAVVSSLKSGDRILAEENLYGCTVRLFERVFGRFGLTAEYADFTKPEALDLIDRRKPALVWLESPTNPLLKIIDIAAVADRCKHINSTVVVDNTFASCLYQQPLALGADLSLTSTTKYSSGHSDCLGGVVCTNEAAWQQKLDFARKALGLHSSPFDAWLISRGLKTLSLRMARHSENALLIARALEELPWTQFVRYPLLPSHPQFATAQKQMSGGSGIITAVFDLTEKQTLSFLRGLKLFTLAESLGGIESLVCHPATMTHASLPEKTRQQIGISEAMVRFSVGVEDAQDLLGDIKQALAQVTGDESLRC